MTNRKLHLRFRLVPKSMTLNDLEGSFRTLFQNTCVFGAHHENLNEDRPYTVSGRDVAQWLVFGNIRFANSVRSPSTNLENLGLWIDEWWVDVTGVPNPPNFPKIDFFEYLIENTNLREHKKYRGVAVWAEILNDGRLLTTVSACLLCRLDHFSFNHRHIRHFIGQNWPIMSTWNSCPWRSFSSVRHLTDSKDHQRTWTIWSPSQQGIWIVADKVLDKRE